MVRTIHLYGELGELFGRVHRFNVKSPGEAIRALIANFPGFEKHMRESESRGVGYRVRNGSYEIDDIEQINDPTSGSIRITPVLLGSGNSAVGKILLGAVLVVAAVVLAPFTAGTSFAWIPTAIGGMGFSLALGGVSQLISPMPKNQGPQESAGNTPSYVFNGPVNTTAQGQPVPIGYGRLIIGGAVVSAGITTEQIKAGFKRSYIEKFTIVWIQTLPTGKEQLNALSPNRVPANWKRREFVRNITGAGIGTTKEYKYYYPVYTLVPA